MNEPPAGVAIWARSALWRILTLSILWWALIEGDPSVAYYGLVLVPVAAAVSIVLHRPRRAPRVSPRQALALGALVRWFIWRSFLGGLDVARRAVSRSADFDPGFVECQLTLPSGLGRLAVIDLTSLMPGTLSAELDGDTLRVHLLHTEIPGADVVAELEARVGRVIGWHPTETGAATDGPR